jgi:hypothetical protein
MPGGTRQWFEHGGDDYVLVAPGEPLTAFRAFRLLKQDREGLARIPGLALVQRMRRSTGRTSSNSIRAAVSRLHGRGDARQCDRNADDCKGAAHAVRAGRHADRLSEVCTVNVGADARRPRVRLHVLGVADPATSVFTMLLSENSSEIADSARRFIEELPA